MFSAHGVTMAFANSSNDKMHPISEQCRVCLERQGFVPIFGDEHNPDISIEFVTFGSVEVHKDDKFPKQICKECLILLDGAVAFRKAAVRSNTILKEGKMEPNSSKSVKTEVEVGVQVFPVKNYVAWPGIFIDQDSLKTNKEENEGSDLDIKNEVEYLDDDFDNEDDDVTLMTIAKNKIKDEYLKCISCNLNFQSTDEFERHKLTCLKKLNYSISILPSKQRKIKSENSKKSQLKNKKCELCKKHYKEETFARHMRDVHKVKISKTPKTKQCPTCLKMFRPDYIVRHMRDVHAQDKKSRYPKPLKCEICNMNFTENMYPRHLREVHKIRPNIPTKTKQCPICKKMFRPDYITRHLKTIHAGEKKQKISVECPVCKKVFSQEYYHVHIKKHDTAQKDYICDICGKEFIFQSAFINHKAIHSNILPYKCDHCPYRGRNKHLLRIHTRTHTGEYPYKCYQCDTRCITKSNLNRHMLKHRGAVDYLCDSCNRGFYTKLELERHISAIHLGIKNHLCNLCGAAFGYKHGLMKHMRKVHKTKGTGRRNALYLKLQSQGDLQESA